MKQEVKGRKYQTPPEGHGGKRRTNKEAVKEKTSRKCRKTGEKKRKIRMIGNRTTGFIQKGNGAAKTERECGIKTSCTETTSGEKKGKRRIIHPLGIWGKTRGGVQEGT